jgi:hypothetical protein
MFLLTFNNSNSHRILRPDFNRKYISYITDSYMENSFNNMNTENTNKNKIELAFPKYEQEDGDFISKGSGQDLVKHLSTSMDSITDWFKQYQVESIELWISGMMETGGITKLVVSAKGEGGMRVMLKPKS